MKNIRLLLILCTITSAVHSQKLHVNLFGGTANYVGELFFVGGNSKHYDMSNAKAAAGIGLEYELIRKVSLRTTLMIGKLGADDKTSKNDIARNLNFKTSIYDLMLAAQYHILDPDRFVIAPYVFSGVAFFHFNPYTSDSLGQKVYLKPLSTEGQGFVEGREPYKLYQFAIPFGAGIKFSFGENFRIAAEVSVRKTFTDYIDDVSTTYVDRNLLLQNRGQQAVDLAYRGDEIKGGPEYPAAGVGRGIPEFKDRYYFSTITASFRLGAISEKFGRSNLKCPSRI
jgi:hypothetical protein